MARAGETILVVEDDDRVRAGVSRQLRRCGYQVHEANSGEAALEPLASIGDTVDLMVTDLVMPGMHGCTLANEVGQRWPDMKIILMSGYSEHPSLQHLGTECDRPLIAKPCATADLERLVRNTLSPRDSRRHVGFSRSASV